MERSFCSQGLLGRVSITPEQLCVPCLPVASGLHSACGHAFFPKTGHWLLRLGSCPTPVAHGTGAEDRVRAQLAIWTAQTSKPWSSCRSAETLTGACSSDLRARIDHTVQAGPGMWGVVSGLLLLQCCSRPKPS